VSRRDDVVCLLVIELVIDRLSVTISQILAMGVDMQNIPFVTSSSPSASISVDKAGARAACLSRGISRLSRPLFTPPETLFLLLMFMLFLKLLLPPKLFLLIRLARRLGILVPIGLYSLMKLFRLQADAKLKDSSFSLCSFLTGARYFARGMVSPGLYTFDGHRSRLLLESVVESLWIEELGDAFRRAFLMRSRNAMVVWIVYDAEVAGSKIELCGGRISMYHLRGDNGIHHSSCQKRGISKTLCSVMKAQESERSVRRG